MKYFHNFEKEPTIKLEQILWFINFYGYIHEISFGTYEFKDGMEFKASHHLGFFENLLQLHLESAINLNIDTNVVHEFGKINKELQNKLKSYQNKNIFGEKEMNVLFLRLDWDEIKTHIKTYDGIAYSIRVNGRRFLELLFCKISQEKGYLDINRLDISKNLYTYILESTDGKQNYNNEIILTYRFDDYLENRRIILPLLVELEELGRIKIFQITLKNNSLSFTLSNILELTKELLDETINKIPGRFYMQGDVKDIEKIEYTKEGVKINDVLWKPKDAKKTEAFLHLVSMYFYENPNVNYIHISRLIDFYDKKKEKLVETLKLKEKHIKNSYFVTLHKKLAEDYNGSFLQMGRGLIEAKKDLRNSSK